MLKGLRGEDSITELYRREGLNPDLYYKWSTKFLDAGKAWLTGDTTCQPRSNFNWMTIFFSWHSQDV